MTIPTLEYRVPLRTRYPFFGQMNVMRKLEILSIRRTLPASLTYPNRILAMTEGKAEFRVRKSEVTRARQLAIGP